METINQETKQIFQRFFGEIPSEVQTINTSRGETDFREVLLVTFASGEKGVLKLSDNDFTFPEKIAMWQRTIMEYRKLGYYCPAILPAKDGSFPTVDYKGRNCVAYREDYSPYRSAEERSADFSEWEKPSVWQYKKDAWIMTAKMAAAGFDYTEYPSGYCLFERFCPSDKTDEVLEDALEWKKYADTLPSECQEQVQRIWQRWMDNRNVLEPIYRTLPTSVFQADLNPTNILLDENGNFVGVFDFNLCGKEVLLNYLFRENHHDDFSVELEMIFRALKIVSEYYFFSDLEKSVALPLYRCLKPLWYTRVYQLKEAGTDMDAVRALLDEIELYQTKEIVFPI